MADRVLMKAKSTFNNPLITVKRPEPKEGEPVRRAVDEHTVDEGDEFSTSEDHATQLEAGGLAERISGKAEAASERAQALVGAQTPTAGAIHQTRETPLPVGKTVTPPKKADA